MSETEHNSSADQDLVELNRLSTYAEKAELYVVSLTFSILALSAQFPLTADPNNLAVLRLQAAGWVFLSVSGVAGIKMLRNISSRYNLIRNERNLISRLKEKIDEASLEILSDVLGEPEGNVKKQSLWLFPLQGYFFVSGVMCLVAARALALPLI